MMEKNWKGASVGRRKACGVNELETLTLAQGGSHLHLVLLVIKADLSVFCVTQNSLIYY